MQLKKKVLCNFFPASGVRAELCMLSETVSSCTAMHIMKD